MHLQNGRTLLPAPAWCRSRDRGRAGRAAVGDAHGPAAEDTDAFQLLPGWQQSQQAAALPSLSRGETLPAPTSGTFAGKKEEEGEEGKVSKGFIFRSPVRMDGGGDEASAHTHSKRNTSIRMDFFQPGKGL